MWWSKYISQSVKSIQLSIYNKAVSGPLIDFHHLLESKYCNNFINTHLTTCQKHVDIYIKTQKKVWFHINSVPSNIKYHLGSEGKL